MVIFTDEIGNVKLNDTIIPGVFESLEINSDIELDEIEIKGQSGKVKQVKGYNDATLQLTIVLDSDEKSTCYNKLETLQALFRKTDKQAKPIVYTIINTHANARNISKVLLVGLKSKETNSNDTILAICSFVEYLTTQITAEKRAATPSTSTNTDIAKTFDTQVTSAYTTPAVDDAEIPEYTSDWMEKDKIRMGGYRRD